jgi:hypothetical protein
VTSVGRKFARRYDMTKIEAVKLLSEYDHCFIAPEGVRKIVEPFDLPNPCYEATDTRSAFKGLTLNDAKEGDSASGCAAHILAMRLCELEGVEYRSMHGVGSQLRSCCSALISHLES